MILVVENASGDVFVPGVLKFGMDVSNLGDGVLRIGACVTTTTTTTTTSTTTTHTTSTSTTTISSSTTYSTTTYTTSHTTTSHTTSTTSSTSTTSHTTTSHTTYTTTSYTTTTVSTSSSTTTTVSTSSSTTTTPSTTTTTVSTSSSTTTAPGDTLLNPSAAWKGYGEPDDYSCEFSSAETQYTGPELTTVSTDDSNSVATAVSGEDEIVGARFEFDTSGYTPSKLDVTVRCSIDRDTEAGDFILRIWDPSEGPPAWETIDTEVDPTQGVKYTLNGQPGGAVGNYIDSNKVYVCAYYNGLQRDGEAFRAFYAELNVGPQV